jgi:hypothetical protein
LTTSFLDALVVLPDFAGDVDQPLAEQGEHYGQDDQVDSDHQAAIKRVTESPTKQGFSLPSTSRVMRVMACHQPPPTSSSETISARARTRESTGTGAENLMRSHP